MSHFHSGGDNTPLGSIEVQKLNPNTLYKGKSPDQNLPVTGKLVGRFSNDDDIVELMTTRGRRFRVLRTTLVPVRSDGGVEVRCRPRPGDKVTGTVKTNDPSKRIEVEGHYILSATDGPKIKGHPVGNPLVGLAVYPILRSTLRRVHPPISTQFKNALPPQGTPLLGYTWAHERIIGLLVPGFATPDYITLERGDRSRARVLRNTVRIATRRDADLYR